MGFFDTCQNSSIVNLSIKMLSEKSSEEKYSNEKEWECVEGWLVTPSSKTY